MSGLGMIHSPAGIGIMRVTRSDQFMSDPSCKPPNGKDLFAWDDGEAGQIARDVICPECNLFGSVRVSPFVLNRERHLHLQCASCRHAWIESDRRLKDRFS